VTYDNQPKPFGQGPSIMKPPPPRPPGFSFAETQEGVANPVLPVHIENAYEQPGLSASSRPRPLPPQKKPDRKPSEKEKESPRQDKIEKQSPRQDKIEKQSPRQDKIEKESLVKDKIEKLSLIKDKIEKKRPVKEEEKESMVKDKKENTVKDKIRLFNSNLRLNVEKEDNKLGAKSKDDIENDAPEDEDEDYQYMKAPGQLPTPGE